MMNKIKIIIYIFFASIFVVSFQGSAKAKEKQGRTRIYSPGDHNFSLVHDSLRRTYSAHVPISYDKSKQTPVILVLHGGGGSGEGVRFQSEMDKSSDKYGFIAVYPDGTGAKVGKKVVGSWNAGKCCPKAMEYGTDDVGFISSLIDDLKIKLNIDPKRVYATGHSNGSQMSFRLACELSDKIAAIAPNGAQGVFDNCNPDRKIPVMYFHGTADHCSSYDGGRVGGCLSEFLNDLLGANSKPYTWDVLSAPDYLEQWKKINGVSGQPEIIYQKGNATCQSWGKDTPGEVVLCTIKDMGHVWPGGNYGKLCADNYESRKCSAFRRVVGALTNDISANDLMWEFFRRHPKE